MILNNKILILSIAAVFAIISCKGPKSRRKKSGPPAKIINAVSTMTVKSEVYYPTIETVAKANPVREVTHAMEASGKLVYLPGEIGEYVEKGQLIARVRTLGLWSQKNAAAARLSEIETALSQAKSDFEQMKKLRKSGAVSQHEFELTENNLKARQAQLSSARASVSQVSESLFGTSLFADFNGEIAGKFQQLGNFAGMGTPVYRIVDLSEIKVQFGISELEVINVKVGDVVHLRTVAYPKRKWEGRVSFISPAADSSTGTYPVEVKFPNTVISEEEKTLKTEIEGKEMIRTYKVRNWAIKAGMTIQGRFFKPAVKGHFIPVDAVLKRGGKTVVFAVGSGTEKDGHSVSIEDVTVHDIYEGWYHISSKSIKDGTRIVVTGNSRLRKDSKVSIKELTISLLKSTGTEWPDALTKATGGKKYESQKNGINENKQGDKSPAGAPKTQAPAVMVPASKVPATKTPAIKPPAPKPTLAPMTMTKPAGK